MGTCCGPAPIGKVRLSNRCNGCVYSREILDVRKTMEIPRMNLSNRMSVLSSVIQLAQIIAIAYLFLSHAEDRHHHPQFHSHF